MYQCSVDVTAIIGLACASTDLNSTMMWHFMITQVVEVVCMYNNSRPVDFSKNKKTISKHALKCVYT